jgi:hypothetical protein
VILSPIARKNLNPQEIPVFLTPVDATLLLGCLETGVSVNVNQTFSVILLLNAKESVNITETVPLLWRVQIISVWTLVLMTFVALMPSVECKTIMLSALALMATLETHSPDATYPNQSVPQILNVQTILHALLKNAKIPASQARVESMLNVGSSSIAQPAFVIEAMLAILTVSAKSLAAKVTMNALTTKHASKENVRIHVLLNNVV